MANKEMITSKSGSFEIIRKLGEGYTGEVYLVKDLSRQEPVALKLLNPEAFKEGQLEAFKREFMLLSDLHHPHICKVHDFGYAEDRGRYFFTLELVQGADLYTYTEDLSVEEIEELFIQIADALGFIHSAGLIHFDVKGDNILITTTQGRPLAKIVDFGLAAPSFEAPENIAGTVRYMSPEMIAKSAHIDYRADLYSLGMVLYRMLAGRYPNQGSTMKEVLNWHTQHDSIETAPLQERGVPPYLIEVIQKLTRRIPTERFSSASVVIKFIELHSGKTYGKTQKKLVATLMEEGPLVARDRIMCGVRSALHQLSQKKPLGEEEHQTLLLTGPPGSGKTRILREAKYISQLVELTTYIIRGENEGQDIGLFKKALGLEDVEDRDLTDSLLERQPVSIMVDNLDRCNPQVREFITGLADFLYSSKFLGEPHQIFLIVTVTAGSPKEPLPVSLHLDVGHEYLSPFTQEDVTQYIRLSLGESNPPASQVQDILKFSGGIPDLVKAAIASLDSPTARLTKDAQQLFVQRIKGLDPAAKKVLGYLALAEKPLTLQQLIAFAGLAIETALSELIKGGLITYNREDESYQIATGAISIAAGKAFSEKDKKEMAAALLNYFEEEEPQDVDSIVKYASISAGPEKLADYLIKAGENKEERSELADACSYYQQAIGCLEGPDPRLPSLHRKLARRLIFSGEHAEAIKHIEEASKLAGVTVEDLTNKIWINRLQLKPERAVEFVDQAIGLTDRDNGNPEYLRLLNERAYCYVQMGKFDEAVKIYERTREHARNLPPEERKKVVNNNLGLAMTQKGNYDAAIEFYKEKYGEFSEDKHLAASILSQLGYAYQQAGLLSEALDAFKKCWEIYSGMGDTHSSMAILGNIVTICQSKALFTDALQYVKESIQLASHAGSEEELAGNFRKLGALYVDLGLEDVARRYLNEAAAIFQKMGNRRMEAWAQISFAYLYKNLGRYKEALAYLNNVIKRGKESKYDDLILWGSYGSADMLLDIGRIEEAEKYLSNIKMEWVGKERARETDIKIELLRCKLLTIKEDKPPKNVASRFEELAELAEKLGLRELAGEVYHNLGTFYQKLGEGLTSAKYVSKAKEIIEDIAGTLSEEYRESFLKQQFRQRVYEDSIRLKDFMSQIEMEEGALKGKVEEEIPRRPKEVAVHIPGEGAAIPEETSIFTGTPVEAAELKIVGQSEAVVKIRELIDQVKDSPATVLISGEEGTGKELIARVIHGWGNYKDRPFIKVDISTFSEEFLENTLWGIDERGVFELAGEGIIFLANIERLPSALHKKLAKVLKRKTFVRLKDKQEIPLRARIIASTNIKYDRLAREGNISKKLIKRFSEVVISVPPLRERKSDIPLLIDCLLSRIAAEKNVSPYSIEPQALKLLMQHNWPGNIRELEQTLRSVGVLVKDGNITGEHVSVYITST